MIVLPGFATLVIVYFESCSKRRQIEEDLVIPKDQFTSRFMTYKLFFNETWGKLYRAELFPSDRKSVV